MTVLLVNPPIDHIIKNVPPSIAKIRDEGYPNLGILYIAAHLTQNSDEEVKIVDAQIERLDYRMLKKRIEKISPDVVGINATSFTLVDALLTAKAVKEVDNGIKTVFGGRHPTLYPKETIGLGVDFCVIGEGEETFTELVKCIANNEKTSSVRGVAFREGENVVLTKPRMPIKDLDGLPFPQRDLTPFKKYRHIMTKNETFTTMMSSRGCPYNCIFCDKSLGNVFRARNPGNVVDEIEECAGMGIKNIFMHDDTFTLDRKRVAMICDEIMKRGIDVNMIVRTRANLVDGGILKKMKLAGCGKIHYGIESGNEEILKTLNKGITIGQVEKAVDDAKKNGIEVLGDFIIGSPGEKAKEILETIRFSIKLGLDYAFFSIATPYPGTRMYRQGLDRGLYHDYWGEFARNPDANFRPRLWTEHLSEGQLRSLYKRAYANFYGRPSFLVKQTLKMSSVKEIAANAKTGLQLFCDVN